MITAEMEEMKMSSVFDTTGSRVTFGFTESGFVEPDSVEPGSVEAIVLVVVARLVLVVVARLVLVVVLVLVVADGTQYS